MGVSTNAILAYGYDLGGGETEIDFTDFDWYDQDEDFEESAMTKLLTEAGFTETDPYADGYHQRRRAAELLVGVQVRSYCSCDYPMYLLAAKVQMVHRGDAQPIDLTLPDNADERLAWAASTLDLILKVDRPQWLLASWWC